jgi:hypothetical protein
MIREYDIVYALRDLSNGIQKGYKGTVLIVHPDFPPAYEVEFVNGDHETLGVLTVKAQDVTYIPIPTV